MKLSVEVDPRDVICSEFLGHGAEWDSNYYTAAGVNDDDFAVIRQRVEWMRMPVARIMMQCKWCYKGNGKYDWTSQQMRALYRHLDVCQKLGTTVFLTDWGCEPSWLRCPDVKTVDDPKYAEIIGTYMDYLLNERGYSCISYFIMVNEPNYEVKDWERWKKGLLNVHAELLQRGLAGRVALTGSDHSNDDNWHRRAVDELKDTLGAYDVHRYARDDRVRSGGLREYFKQSWDYARAHDPAGRSKPCVVGEAGRNDRAQHPRGNLDIDTFAYGVFMADYAVQAANAGSAATMAWMLDDNSHGGFFWGMWTNKEKGLKLRPWFYPWSLLSRCFPSGSRIVRTRVASEDVRVLAACDVDRGGPATRSWSFCLVNRSDAPATVRLRVKGGPRVRMNRYVYSATSRAADARGFPTPVDRRAYALGSGADVVCEPDAVVILTSLAK